MEEKQKILTREDCSKFETCNAQLCPHDSGIAKRLWYADEDICTKHTRLFIKNQRKIKKIEAGGLFTHEMLNRHMDVRRGFTGLIPDSYEPIEKEVKKWGEKHPGISDYERKRRREEGKARAQRLMEQGKGLFG